MPSLFSLTRLPHKLRRKARRSRLATMIVLLSTLCLLITPIYLIYKPPHLLIRYFQHRWPDVLWHVPTPSKLIALTIDDAPSEHTHEILQVLKANDAAATFFVIGGQVEGREAVMREIVSGGNELGNHAMHDEPSRSLSNTVLLDQIASVESMIKQTYAATGIAAPPKYFRPGSGFFSARMRQLLAESGYRIVLGSVYPHDPQIPYWRVNARHVLSMVRPGAIIICHDRRSWTAPMLRKVLPELRKRGYRVVTVTELLEAGKT